LREARFTPSSRFRLQRPRKSLQPYRTALRHHQGRHHSACRASWWPFGDPKIEQQSLTLQERIKITEDEFARHKTSFPEVEDITAEELHKLLEDDPGAVVLVDVRTPEERQVSQIPGRVLSPAAFDAQKAELKGTTAVCYCTAGMRSGKHAAKLQKEGVKVKNLKGSIIAWTQHGYPLVEGDGGKKGTTRVHTFGAHWANQMGDGYKLQYFSAAKGALEITKSVLPKWLGGSA